MDYKLYILTIFALFTYILGLYLVFYQSDKNVIKLIHKVFFLCMSLIFVSYSIDCFMLFGLNQLLLIPFVVAFISLLSMLLTGIIVFTPRNNKKLRTIHVGFSFFAGVSMSTFIYASKFLMF